MKITINEKKVIQIEEVFNSVVLKTNDGEQMYICMRDSGFEFKYQGKWYFAKEGYVEPFNLSVRGNPLVDQTHQEEDEDVNVRKIVRCEDPMVCLRGCSVHEQTCKHPIYENQIKTKRR